MIVYLPAPAVTSNEPAPKSQYNVPSRSLYKRPRNIKPVAKLVKHRSKEDVYSSMKVSLLSACMAYCKLGNPIKYVKIELKQVLGDYSNQPLVGRLQ